MATKSDLLPSKRFLQNVVAKGGQSGSVECCSRRGNGIRQGEAKILPPSVYSALLLMAGLPSSRLYEWRQPRRTLILANTSPFPLLTRWRCSLKNSASLACATLNCEVFSDFQTSLPPAKALA
jgi:hypothetical protein